MRLPALFSPIVSLFLLPAGPWSSAQEIKGIPAAPKWISDPSSLDGYDELRSYSGVEWVVRWNEATETIWLMAPKRPFHLLSHTSPTQKEIVASVIAFLDSTSGFTRVDPATLGELRVSRIGTGYSIGADQIIAGFMALSSGVGLLISERGNLVLFTAAIYNGSPPENDGALTQQEAIAIATRLFFDRFALRPTKLFDLGKKVAFIDAKPLIVRIVCAAVEPLAVMKYALSPVSGALIAEWDPRLSESACGHVEATGTDPLSLFPDPLPQFPNLPDNSPIVYNLAKAKVDLLYHGTSTHTDSGGKFCFIEAPDPVWLRAQLEAPAFYVTTEQGDAVYRVVCTHPSGRITLRLNSIPSEFSTAQVNAFSFVGHVEDWTAKLIERNGIDFSPKLLHLHTNVPISCGMVAWYYCYPAEAYIDLSASNDCYVNLAYSTVVYHEYGHHFYTRAALRQDGDQIAKREAFADTHAAFCSGQCKFGHAYDGQPGSVRRNVDEPDRVWCVAHQDPHVRGLALSGAYWDLRKAVGSNVAENLYAHHVSYYRDNVGYLEPEMGAILILLDDNIYGDNDPSNGSPHKEKIVESFNLHNLYPMPFVRGDVDINGSLNDNDYSLLASYVNNPEGNPLACLDAGDVNDDGEINPADVLQLIYYVNEWAEEAPSQPFPECGTDPVTYIGAWPHLYLNDDLSCLHSSCPY